MMEKKKPSDKKSSNSEESRKALVGPINDSCFKKYCSEYTTEDNIAQGSSYKMTKTKKQRDKASNRTKTTMKLSSPSDSDISTTSNESASILQQRLKLHKKFHKSNLKGEKQLMDTNGALSDSMLAALPNTKKSDRRYTTLSEILEQSSEEKESDSSSGQESEISKLSRHSLISLKKLSYLKRDLKVFRSKENEKKTPISGEEGLLFKSQMAKALNTFKEACSEFELQMEHVKWRHFKKDLVYRENASNVLSKSRKVITRMKRELENQENALINFYHTWSRNCSLKTVGESSIEDDSKCLSEDGLVSKCDSDNTSIDMFKTNLEESMDKDIFENTEDDEEQKDLGMNSLVKTTKKCTERVCSVEDPMESNHQTSKESSKTKELTECNTKNLSTENIQEKGKTTLNDEKRKKKVIPESDSESQHDEEFVDGTKNSKRGMESQQEKKNIGAKISKSKKSPSVDGDMIRELETITERCTMNSDERPSSASNAIGAEEELDDDSANIRAKAALMASSNSDSSSSENAKPFVTVPTRTVAPKSTRIDRKNRLKRIHSSDSESSINAVKKRRTKLEETASCDADKQLQRSCRVVVERLSGAILEKYAQALQKSKQRLDLKEMKSLIDLDRLERNQKEPCQTPSKGSSKKTDKEKEIEDTLLDHLEKVGNGEQFENLEEETKPDDDNTTKNLSTTIQSNEDLILEADKAIKNTLLNSSDSEMGDTKSIEKSSENEAEKSKTISKDSSKKTKLKKEKKSSPTDHDNEEEREKSKWRRSKLLTAKLSDTDSDVAKEKCKAQQEKLRTNVKQNDAESSDLEEIVVTRKRRGRRKILDSDSDVQYAQSDLESDNSVTVEENTNTNVKEKHRRRTRASRRSSDSDSTREEKKTKPRRRRIKKMHSDSDSDRDDDDPLNTSQSPGKKGRKNIRKVMKDKQVTSDTKQAAKEEEERVNRIAERQKLYNEMYEARLAGEEKVDKLVLDFNPETKEELISVHENLVQRLKPHQAKGIKFMWDACFETLDRIKTSTGSGCIIAHCMGLGKTLQVIALVHTLLNYEETGIKTIMVVCPLSTVHNWVNEFQSWLSDIDNGDIEVYELTKFKKNIQRAYQLKSWQRTGGVLIIGYEMFRNLNGPCKNMRKKLKAEILECLVDPGPDLVVCDEGHLLKNEDTALSKSMSRIKTLRRVVLTGTPLQNNLREYHCMVQFVKPNLLGTRVEFLNRFVNPITNGQFDDSTEGDVKLMKKRAYVLHKMLKGCVQRFDYSVLTPFLPPKHEYVIFISLSEVQVKMYQHYLDNFARRHRGAGGSLFADFQVLQRIWTHPFVLRLNAEKIEKMNENKDSSSESEGSLRDFIDDTSTSDSQTSSSGRSVQATSDTEVQPSGSKDNEKDNAVNEENNTVNLETEEIAKDEKWWLQFTQPEHFEDMRISAKLVLLFGILKESEQIGDKVLVFSQSLYSLSLIEHFLDRIHEETQSGTSSENISGHSGSWCQGLDYFRLDGQMTAEHRSRACKIFNRPTNTRARLFLISTRAGGLGINLTAANRVIIFDASWNPSHDVQSIFRVYRFGQKKPCYVYRFLAAGTMEEKIYNRQVTKLSLSCRVVDEQQIERHYSNHDLSELYKFEPNVSGVKPTLNLPKDRVLAEIFLKYKDHVENYHEHDSLLENKADEELDEEERKLAWQEYEDEKKGKPIQPFGLKTMLPNNLMSDQYGNISHVTTDYLKLQELIRKDYPNATPEYQKLLTTKALTDMYNYWEQQTVFNNMPPQLIQNTRPNPQVPAVIHPNTMRPQQLSMVRTVQKIDSNGAGGHLRDTLSNTSGYQNVDPSTSGVTDGDVIEVLPTTTNTATRPVQNSPQLNSKGKNQEE